MESRPSVPQSSREAYALPEKRDLVSPNVHGDETLCFPFFFLYVQGYLFTFFKILIGG